MSIWRKVVFQGIQSNVDPLEPIQTLIENDLRKELGRNVFEGSCFFHSMLVELSGQSIAMSNHLMQGFKQLAGLLIAWLKEAHDQGHLKENLNFNENRRNPKVLSALNRNDSVNAGKNPARSLLSCRPSQGSEKS